MSIFESIGGEAEGAFRARADDIVVASYPRSGTTWLLMIVWHLMAGRDMSFGHLSHVIPLLEAALRSGRNCEKLQSPRILKSHLPFEELAGWPGRCLYVARDGRDVFVSRFHFSRAYSSRIESLDTFFDKFMTGDVAHGSWFEHVAGWKAHARDPNVLFLTYEEMMADFDRSLQKIVAFLGVPLAPHQRQHLIESCSFAAMRAQEHKFDPGAHARPGAFVREGQVGGWRKMLTPAQQHRFEQAVAILGGIP